MEQSQGGYPPPTYRNALESERDRSARTLTHVLYALYAVYWLTGGISVLIAIIGTVGMSILAARIYRRAVLRTGGRVRLRDLLAPTAH